MFDMNNSYFKQSTHGRYYPICVTNVSADRTGTAQSDYQAGAYYNANHTSLIVEGGYSCNWEALITLRYTKTTD